MSEAVKNPYAVDNMLEGGGLTRDIVVTAAKYTIFPMVRGDGSKVLDDKGGQSYFIGLSIEGLSTDPRAEGKTGKYEWSSGKKAKPSPDGEMLLDDKGAPALIYKSSGLGKAVEGLRAGGFDPALLYPRVSYLVGAKLTLGGENKIGKDGKPKTHVAKSGPKAGQIFNDIEWFPIAYHGGAGSRAQVAAGNGAADLTAKAEAAVVAAIIEAGGAIERKDLIRALGTSLKGDADAIKVTTLVARQDFHTGKPWTFDGTRLALAEA